MLGINEKREDKERPDRSDLIRKIDLFEGLSPRLVQKIAEKCFMRHYSAGDYIVKQGEVGLGLFFITQGTVNVEVERNGTKTIVAKLRGNWPEQEEIFGELSIIDNKPRSANVICEEDTECLLLTRDSFLKLLHKHPEVTIQMVKALGERLRNTTDQVTSRAISDPSSVPTARATGNSSPQPVAPSAAAPAEFSSNPQDAGQPTEAEPEGEQEEAPGVTGSKAKLRDFVVDTFSRFFMIKAMTRFSAAVVGCPVRVVPESGMVQDAVGEVKFGLFPTDHDRVLSLEAFGGGDLSVTVLRPGSGSEEFSMECLEGRVEKDETLRLRIPKGTGEKVELRQSTRKSGPELPHRRQSAN